MTFTPAEHFVFGGLTVLDNLRLGGLADHSGMPEDQRLDGVFEVFPKLRVRLGQMAGTMSGGEQRMVSLGMALMATPRLMLLDEPSLGLSPVLVTEMMDVIRAAAEKNGTAVVLLEQNVAQALRAADRVYVMRGGRIILEETADRMIARESWWDLF
jgi:ABC-type branched-chain amino acid transport systems, ATPase component